MCEHLKWCMYTQVEQKKSVISPTSPFVIQFSFSHLLHTTHHHLLYFCIHLPIDLIIPLDYSSHSLGLNIYTEHPLQFFLSGPAACSLSQTVQIDEQTESKWPGKVVKILTHTYINSVYTRLNTCSFGRLLSHPNIHSVHHIYISGPVEI